MANPTRHWDGVPVFGVWMRAPGDTPEPGNVRLKVAHRIQRVDGRIVYPAGATVLVTIGEQAGQDPDIRSAVRAAWRAADEAADGVDFDGVAWDTWWDTKVVPAAIFTRFPALDDPDLIQDEDNRVIVSEQLESASGREYAIQPLLAHLDLPIPGVNLGAVVVPPGSPTVPAPVYAKGIPGGVAGLDADGDVVDASGTKVGTGGSAELTSYATQVAALPDYPVTFPPTGHSHPAGEVSGLAPVATSGAYADLTGKPTIPTAYSDLSGTLPTAALPPLAINETFTAASQAAMLALTAQRGDMAIRTDNGRTYVLSSDSPGTLADWKEVQAAGQVVSVAGKTGTVTLTATDISNSTATGRSLLTAADAAAARTAAGVAYGTTAGTVLQGNWRPGWQDLQGAPANDQIPQAAVNGLSTSLSGKATIIAATGTTTSGRIVLVASAADYPGQVSGGGIAGDVVIVTGT